MIIVIIAISGLFLNALVLNFQLVLFSCLFFLISCLKSIYRYIYVPLHKIFCCCILYDSYPFSIILDINCT